MPSIACFGVGNSAPRVYHPDASGHWIELAWVGNWVGNDLTRITKGEPGVTPLTCFGADGNNPRVYFLVPPGQVNELAFVGQWVQNNITALAAAPPANGVALACFGIDGRTPRVYYIADSSNHVVELALVGGWTHKDLTAITSAPAIGAESDLTCFGFDVAAFGAGGPGARVYYLGQNGHVNELAWDVDSFQEPEGKWTHNDVTLLAGAAPADPPSLACVGVGGAESLVPPSARVYYLDRNGHVNELAWVGRWVSNDLTAIAGASPASRGSPLTCFAVDGSAPRVYYLDGHVHELAWGGKRWIHTDITAQAGGPSPIPINFSSMSCFGVDGRAARIYYRFVPNGHVFEVAWIGRWVSNDLTLITGAPPFPHVG